MKGPESVDEMVEMVNPLDIKLERKRRRKQTQGWWYN